MLQLYFRVGTTRAPIGWWIVRPEGVPAHREDDGRDVHTEGDPPEDSFPRLLIDILQDRDSQKDSCGQSPRCGPDYFSLYQ